MKLTFFGTSEFARLILESIVRNTGWEINLVVSEPSKPSGRDRKTSDSPVASAAKNFGIEVFSPDRISNKESVKKLLSEKSDAFVVSAYGQIIPKSIFDAPKFKTINIHPSLLPKLRGPSPIQTAFLEGLKETGASLMLIDEKMDHGPILSREIIAISDDDNYQALENKLSDLGSKMLIRDLPKYINGDIKPIPQNEADATYTRLIKKENGLVDWNKSANEIFNQWRAFSKWPGIYSFFKNRNGESVRLKLVEVTSHSHSTCHSRAAPFRSPALEGRRREGGKPGLDHGNDANSEPGTIETDDKKNLFIICGSGAINIKKLQPENSKTQTAAEFLNGYGYVVGQKLG